MRVGRGARALVGCAAGFAVGYLLVASSLPDPPPAEAPVPDREVWNAAEEAATLEAPPGEPPDAERDRDTGVSTTAAAENEPERATSRDQAPPSIGTLVWGRVTHLDGAALEEAWVGSDSVDGERRSVRCDDAGRYTFGPLPPGTRRVVGRAMHHHDHSVELELSEQERFRRQDFVLRPKRRVSVYARTSDGRPTAEVVERLDALPVATRDDPGAAFTGVRGSLNNRFGIGTYWGWGRADVENEGDGFLGKVTLHEDGPAWMSLVQNHQVLAKQRLAPDTTEVVFVVDPADVAGLRCTVRGRAVAAGSGAPLQARVYVCEHDFPSGRKQPTEPDGTFLIEEAPPGQRFLIVTAEGRANLVRSMSLRPGEVHDAGELALHEPVHLAGRVRRADRGALEAKLSCGRIDPATGDVRWPRNIAYASRADGTFRISGLEPGLYLLRSPGLEARPPRSHDPSYMSLPVRVDAREGPVENLELVLHPTTPITLVTEDVAEPWPRVVALDADGLPVRTVWPGRWRDETPLHLPPGRYTLEIERDGVLLDRRPLAVGDEPRRIELDLE